MSSAILFADYGVPLISFLARYYRVVAVTDSMVATRHRRSLRVATGALEWLMEYIDVNLSPASIRNGFSISRGPAPSRDRRDGRRRVVWPEFVAQPRDEAGRSVTSYCCRPSSRTTGGARSQSTS